MVAMRWVTVAKLLWQYAKIFVTEGDHAKGRSNLVIGVIGVPTSKSPFPVGDRGPVYNTVLVGTTRVSLPNGISFRPTAIAGCTCVTDTHTDGPRAAAVTSVALVPNSTIRTSATDMFTCGKFVVQQVVELL